MTVADVLSILEAVDGYVQNSMVNKSYNTSGCTYKFLCKSGDRALREEVFISTNVEDAELPLLQRRALEYIFIQEPR